MGRKVVGRGFIVFRAEGDRSLLIRITIIAGLLGISISKIQVISFARGQAIDGLTIDRVKIGISIGNNEIASVIAVPQAIPVCLSS